MESHFDYREPANGVMNVEQPPTDGDVFEDAAEVEVFYLEEQVLDSHFDYPCRNTRRCYAGTTATY